MTKNNDEFQGLLDDFQEAAHGAAKQIGLLIADLTTEIRNTGRMGDVRTEMESSIYDTFYRPLARKHKMLQICEENDGAFTGKSPWGSLSKKKYFLILDTLDATVNALCGLTCGVNIAIGRIQPGATSITIGDIKGVLVMDYQSLKTFRWCPADKLIIRPPRYHCGAYRKNKDAPPLFYEAPDEASYASKKYPFGPSRQKRLLNLFRRIYPHFQRRAIDCTGLRMLEIAENNIVAYGDVRSATETWDTIPSIRILLESPDIVVFDSNLRVYSAGMPIVRAVNGKVHRDDDLGRTVIVVRRSDADLVEEYREYLLDDNEVVSLDTITITHEPREPTDVEAPHAIFTEADPTIERTIKCESSREGISWTSLGVLLAVFVAGATLMELTRVGALRDDNQRLNDRVETLEDSLEVRRLSDSSLTLPNSATDTSEAK